jgi:fermentation-respiration switch protein FrsA (DUF1100 family)
MMIHLIHWLIVTVYLACPLFSLGNAIRLRAWHNRRGPLRRFRVTVIGGTGVGIVICVVYAAALGARLIFSQVLLTAYLATSMMLLLQCADHLLWHCTRWMFRLGSETGSEWWYTLRSLGGLVVRLAVILGLGVPYMLAVVVTYRPKVQSMTDPETLYNWKFARVDFPATDGTHIAGWWIPAIGGESKRTVLLCPGPNADKSAQLFMVKKLVPDGYNVLVFDFRGHGDSGGQLCSFGDLERYDVLGAMRWLRKNHTQAASQVDGLGVNTGAAALLAAAADPSLEGQNIDAIAIYSTFDRLDHEVDSLASMYVPPPMKWVVTHLGLAMAGYQVGADLKSFSPAAEINAIWPRPVLVIHGMDDQIVPLEQGESLYDAAMQPKMNYWIERCGHAGAIKNTAAARLVRKCFDQARRIL